MDLTKEAPVKFDKQKSPTAYDDALNLTGYGRFNIVLLLACGGCLMTVQTESLSAGYILPAAQCDFNLSDADKGLLSSICFIGFITSSHFWGFLADTKGRKNILIVSLLLSFTCTLAASFVAQFWLYILLRFCTGFFLAAPAATVYAYLGEFHGVKYRAKSIAWASIILSAGIILLPVLAWLIIPMKWSLQLSEDFTYKPWRLFVIVCGLPSLFFAIMLIPFPESPKFLLMHGRRESALEILKKVYVINTGQSSEQYPVKELADTLATGDTIKGNPSSAMYIFRLMWNQTTPLFCPPHLYNTALTSLIQFGLFIASTGLLLWFPDIMNRMADQANLGEGAAMTVCDALTTPAPLMNNLNAVDNLTLLLECNDSLDPVVFQQNLIIGIGYAVGYLLIGTVINALGKKFILVFCQGVSVIAGFLLLYVEQMILVQIYFIILLVLSGLCVMVVSIAVIDLYPTYLRGMAVCLNLMVGRIGSVLASSVIGVLIQLNCEITFLSFASILLLTGVMSFFIPRDITEGK